MSQNSFKKALFGLTALTGLFFVTPVLGASAPQQCVTNAVAGGTADAITVPLLPCGLATNILILTITANNTTTTPTLQMAGFPAQRIYTNTLQNPGIGDFGSAGSVLMLASTGSSWLIINGNVGGYIPLPLVVADGGTGDATLTSHGILYGNGTSPVGVTAAGTNGQLLTGVTGSAPIWAAATSTAVTSLSFSTTGLTPSSPAQGAIVVAGDLVVANGGTGATSLTSNGVLYGNGTSAIGAVAAGTTGQILIGTTSSAPSWLTAGTTGQYLKATTGLAPSWGTLASDTVSTISFGTTGLTPNSATVGAVTVAGTLGFANGGTSNTSYTNGQLLIGNTGTGGLSKATLTAGTNVTITNSAGGITIASTGLASGCGTGAAPAGQVLTADGATACTANADMTFATGVISLGTSGSEVGKVKLFNATTGSISLVPTTGGLGTVTATFPANTGTVAELNLAQTWTAAQSFNSSDLILNGSGSGSITLNAAASAGTTTITLPGGSTDFSATGGTSQVVKQIGTGVAFTVARLACSDLSDAGSGCTGSGASWPPAPTVITADPNPAVVNTLYCANTTGGAFNLTLPASPSNGDKVGFIDCASKFGTNAMTVIRNGKSVMGLSENMTVNTNFAAGTLTYVSANNDWRLN